MTIYHILSNSFTISGFYERNDRIITFCIKINNPCLSSVPCADGLAFSCLLNIKGL